MDLTVSRPVKILALILVIAGVGGVASLSMLGKSSGAASGDAQLSVAQIRERLQRHLAIERGIACQVHDAHATCADSPLDDERAADAARERRDRRAVAATARQRQRFANHTATPALERCIVVASDDL